MSWKPTSSVGGRSTPTSETLKPGGHPMRLRARLLDFQGVPLVGKRVFGFWPLFEETSVAEDAASAVFYCGPSSRECKCECATGGPCEHVWDGPTVSGGTDGGGDFESATCSKCSMSAIGHAMWVGP